MLLKPLPRGFLRGLDRPSITSHNSPHEGLAMIKVKSGRYDFFINGRQIFVRDSGINGSSIILAKNDLDLTPHEYARLIDDIYRRRITDTGTLMTRVCSSYKLVPTSRKLPK